MALGTVMMAEACRFIKPGARVAAMGYPDIIAPMEAVRQIAGDADVTFRDDSEAICKRHGLEQRPIPDARSFFAALGAELHVFDVVAERGGEIIADLNYPMKKRYLGEYDMVLDVGTLEHCFNIGQAALNMAGLLKVGGVILHENPFNWGNHGFYGLNPTWYADFYGQPGWALGLCSLLARDGTIMVGAIPHTRRFVFTQLEVNVFATACRTGIAPIGFPVQTKYAKLIGANPKGVEHA